MGVKVLTALRSAAIPMTFTVIKKMNAEKMITTSKNAFIVNFDSRIVSLQSHVCFGCFQYIR